jgi:hypothetical protein
MYARFAGRLVSVFFKKMYKNPQIPEKCPVMLAFRRRFYRKTPSLCILHGSHAHRQNRGGSKFLQLIYIQAARRSQRFL